MPDIFVQSYSHLKDMQKADKALHMLQRVASLVKPIMRKRAWVLPVLAEFFPDDANLLGLNINAGQKILVRLRPAHSPDSFLPEEDVIHTMLHELTHNVHGPHDEKFYKYLDVLQDEYDALQRSGYAGEGFFSDGKRLGKNVSHNVPQHLARQKALEAAEKRAKTSRLLGPGGRLGGSASKHAGLSPRELAARAAEKRLRDEKACASGEQAKREAEKAAKASVTNTVIDLTMEETGSSSDSDVVIVKDLHPRTNKTVDVVAGSPKATTSNSTLNRDVRKVMPVVERASSTSTKRPTPSNTNPEAPAKKKRQADNSNVTNWPCPACTLINLGNALQCDACGMRKPYDEREGWTCLKCGELGNPHEHWTCRFCSEVKLFS